MVFYPKWGSIDSGGILAALMGSCAARLRSKKTAVLRFTRYRVCNVNLKVLDFLRGCLLPGLRNREVIRPTTPQGNARFGAFPFFLLVRHERRYYVNLRYVFWPGLHGRLSPV